MVLFLFVTWEQRKLGDVGKAQSGIGFPDREQGGKEGVPFYKVSDMNNYGNEHEMHSANNYVTEEQCRRNGWTPITEISVVFAKVGAAIMLNRKRLVRFSFLLDNNTMAYRFGSGWDINFGKTLFERVDLTELVQIGALPSYNATDVESVEISMPDKPEQYQIGEFFKQLDNLITLHQRKQKCKFLSFPTSKAGLFLANSWEQRKLGDTIDFYSGLTYSPSDIVKDDGVFVLRSCNVQEGEIVDDDNVYVRAGAVNSDNVSVDDIIVVVRNGSRSLIGKHAKIKKNMPKTVIGAFMTGLRYKNSAYLNAVLNTSIFAREIEKDLGATINQITTGAFRKMVFPFPKQPEQSLIGNFFEQLDNLITLHQRKYFCNTLSIQPFSLCGCLSNFTNAWEQRKFDYFFTERTDRSGDGELISVTINSGIKKFAELNRFDSKPEDMSNYKVVCEGDIAYNSMRMWQGASGYSPYNGILSPAYTVIVPKNGVSSKFFAYVLKRPKMIHLFEINSQGLTKDTWNLKFPAFSQIEATAPMSFDEQDQISTFLEQLDNLITLHQRKVEKLKNIKSALLEKMFV